MQLQQAIDFPRRSYSTLVAVVATIVAAMLAVALVVNVQQPATSALPAVVTLHGVGAEQVAHNRSEEGLGSSSVGAQQVAHDRSEQGFANP